MKLLIYVKKEKFKGDSSYEELKNVSITLKKVFKNICFESILEKERHNSLINIVNTIDGIDKNGLSDQMFYKICQMIRIHEIKFADLSNVSLKGVKF